MKLLFIKPSTNEGKKLMAKFENNGRTKTIHFGASGMMDYTKYYAKDPELAKQKRGNTVYLLDEPTTGLHFEDVRKLLIVLNRLVEKGNSIYVIEHNLDVIKCCDYVIDLGAEGGDYGGEVIATGTPEEICKVKRSRTGMFLKNVLQEKVLQEKVL